MTKVVYVEVYVKYKIIKDYGSKRGSTKVIKGGLHLYCIELNMIVLYGVVFIEKLRNGKQGKVWNIRQGVPNKVSYC